MPIEHIVLPAIAAGAVGVAYLIRRRKDIKSEKELRKYFDPLLNNSDRLGELDDSSIKMLEPNPYDGKRSASYKSKLRDYAEKSLALKKASELEAILIKPEEATARQE